MDAKTQKPMVSIVSVNYDQPKVTCEMLESLRKVTDPNFETLIVDNGSLTTSPYIIKEKYPEVQLKISKKNLGFAEGNNIALNIQSFEIDSKKGTSREYKIGRFYKIK